MCCPNRVARLIRLAGTKPQIGYKCRPVIYGSRPAVAIDNTLDRQFDVAAPGKAWVMNITDIVLQAFLTAVSRRKPKEKVLIRSGQGSQFTSMDWAIPEAPQSGSLHEPTRQLP